jgi:hypothetical protein
MVITVVKFWACMVTGSFSAVKVTVVRLKESFVQGNGYLTKCLGIEKSIKEGQGPIRTVEASKKKKMCTWFKFCATVDFTDVLFEVRNALVRFNCSYTLTLHSPPPPKFFHVETGLCSSDVINIYVSRVVSVLYPAAGTSKIVSMFRMRIPNRVIKFAFKIESLWICGYQFTSK